MATIEIMKNLIFLFLSGFISFALYPLWINFVYKFQMGESVRGDGPKTHLVKIGTPTMGGLVFALVVVVINIILNRSRNQTVFPLFIACLGGLIGLLEDFTKVYRKSGLPGFFEYHFSRIAKSPKLFHLKRLFIFKPWYLFKEFWRIVGSSNESGIPTYQKFIFQALIGGFVSFWTYVKLGWDYVWLPLIGNVHLGWIYPLFVFIFFIVVLNSIAFTDGLDGLAGGLSLIVLISFWVVSEAMGYNNISTFCAIFVGALLPFMYFNVFPARVFMGNVGSHFIGASFSVLAVILHKEIFFIIASLPFLVDGISSPLQQISVKLTGKRLFRMAPIHHHFELLGWHESKVTLRFYLFGIFFAFLGIFVAMM